MRIRMRVDVSGTREGREWPRRGSVIELPDDEARQYCEAGMADPVATFTEAETATLVEPEVRGEPASGLTTDSMSGAAVRRGPGRPRKTPQMVNAKES